MGFGGQADWGWIADLKQYLDIPVIGNGDVVDARSAKRMIDETGCDGVMIARASYGNPWIFRECEHYLETGELLPEPDIAERLETMIEHLRLAVEWKGERRACLEMRKQMAYYVRALPGVRALRERINQAESLQAMLDSVREWSESVDWDLYHQKRGELPESRIPPHRSVSLRVA